MSIKNYLILVSSELLGSGDYELGKKLMNSYIYSLTQIENSKDLPTYMLFMNSGVNLVTLESNSLDDLKILEKNGVKIFACGTCLNYYSLEDQLAVGEVGNMYLTTELFIQVDKVITITGGK